jgi:formylglycine-generating enzyme required for sulfatase activity/flavodoxin
MNRPLKIPLIILAAVAIATLAALGPKVSALAASPVAGEAAGLEALREEPSGREGMTDIDNFILIKGGSFMMGSPESEPWRGADERSHKVTLPDFYISPREVTQGEYKALTGKTPSYFKGDDLPLERINWFEAIEYCNLLSEKQGLRPAYKIEGKNISWDRSSPGYRLPTEAEWEYAARAGTITPFNTEKPISPNEANFYGSYPYEIENNYFSQENLTVKPGIYRDTTVPPGSFPPNKLGLYDMHGNVGEWTFDYYGEYSPEGPDAPSGPSGPASGTLKVYRGGGWNDFAKNLRSAYRAALPPDKRTFNIGIRLARNAAPGSGIIEDKGPGILPATGAGLSPAPQINKGKVLIVFYSWGGNTRGIANEIKRQTNAELFEIKLTNPYSNSYNTVLEEAQRDQNRGARPKIEGTVKDFSSYDIILLGYPNWWASIPMPIATFLEQYDTSGKTIIPFCSHGGGRFGQSLSAISKLAPKATMGEALSVHYSGGSSLRSTVTEWLKTNGIGAN